MQQHRRLLPDRAGVQKRPQRSNRRGIRQPRVAQFRPPQGSHLRSVGECSRRHAPERLAYAEVAR
eukprot:scaffold1021_cov108-Isochrysis_galbana.AAC.4